MHDFFQSPEKRSNIECDFLRRSWFPEGTNSVTVICDRFSYRDYVVSRTEVLLVSKLGHIGEVGKN